MASATAITYVHENLIGDPLDVRMFQSTGWVLDESAFSKAGSAEEGHVLQHVHPVEVDKTQGKGLYKSALLRRFDFESSLQRMSVICRNEFDNKLRLFIKGSPEKISDLCEPNTLPRDFNQVMSSYTKDGYRVIAIAYKELGNLSNQEVHTIERDRVECDLTFLGLLIMENKLKPETKGVIATLNECNVRPIMATGDNVLTAISVARQCSILNDQQEVFLADVITDNAGE